MLHQSPAAIHFPPFRHPRFGNLALPGTVTLPTQGKPCHRYSTRRFAMIHLSVTGRCHARCQGCVNAAITAGSTKERNRLVPIADTLPQRDAACIIRLVRGPQDGKEPVICFYGGEPLLAADKIVNIMELLKDAGLSPPPRFMLYTNGDRLENAVESVPAMLASLWLLSVSIDGRSAQHERFRPGTSLERIHRGLESYVRHKASGATVLMWSTLREEQELLDCFREFRELESRTLVDQWFWHWAESTEPFRDLEGFATRYETALEAVMDDYLDRLGRGRIPPFPHINELVLFALSGNGRATSACGVECSGNYDLIDGKIHACADLPLDLAIGTIEPDGTPRITPRDLSFLLEYKNELGCNSCGVHRYCSGRCPVQACSGNRTRLHQYCRLMRLHVAVVLERLDAIERRLLNASLSTQDLYQQSAFLTPFTDVTP